MRKLVAAAAFGLAASLLCAQAPAPASATVHLYRAGSGEVGLQTFIDGKEEFKIGNHKIATFQLLPGYHELTIKFGNDRPTVALHAQAGGEYFVQLRVDIRKAALFTGAGANAVAVNLDKEDGVLDQDKLKPEQLAPDVLTQIAASTMEVAAASTAPADLEYMTDDEVRDAVLEGAHNDSPVTLGLYLNDVQMNVFSHALADGEYANSGFSVIIFTPKKWIAYQASLAHKLMKPFSLAEVTPEMRAKVLHVIALPKTPDRLDGAGMSASSGVARIVLADRTKGHVVQPINERPDVVTVDSALRSKDYTKLSSDFNMADVSQLRAYDKKSEFFVIVIGEDGSRKYFDVKQKDAGWL